ncbi:S9 family peptidase [Bacillus haynesii]|uniref:S9 family peptidase n=1 Tax=Bacillus haynesii TaxID=1925021 RepID=UPI0012B7C1E6|nr:S9 family peptidase [Bacillus haynesii]TWK14391.1 Dipeptidyl aminopeptidase BIII [Bacillus licheniformis]MCY7990570.1 S9 family peptidase [Bacillus haynesii]MCY8091690.1 S9 family peptidase [Bacillus haynesii]MCY8217639.1 S9 family peptidase [Bacillus haynesii]MCY8294704.1 S9 family peptidase [Bacillus haynesii]
MEKAESILHVLRIKDFAVHPDETQLVFDTNLNGTSNLWAMDLPDTYPYQLSFLNQDSKGIAYNPDGSILFAGFDNDGNEQSGLYKLSSKNGSLHSLNGNQTDRHFEPIPVQNAVYYSSTKDNPTFLNTYRYDCLTEKEELIFEGKDGTSILADVSPGEKAVSIHVYYVNSHNVCMIHTAEGVTTGIVPDETLHHMVYSSHFASDDRLFVTTNYEAEFSYLALYTVSSGIFTPVLSIDKTDLTSIHADPNGTFLYLIGKKGVKEVMYEYNTATGESRQVDCPCTSISKIHCASSGALYMLGSTPTRPANLYVLMKGQAKWRQLTKHSVPGFSEQELSYPEVVTYPSFDGLAIEGLLFKPAPEEANGWTIIWPHGGPQDAETFMFYDIFQLAAKMGYQLFAPNFRGSANYGYSFFKMVEQDWGDGPRLDMTAGIDWLIDQKLADREKLFLMGGSYGGYMSLLLHGRHPEYFRAVVDICGVSNLFSFVKSVPDFWQPMMEKWVGNPERDYEKMKADSPVTYLENMTQPMLIIQGANDPRVVKEESDQVVDRLKDMGRNIEYLVLENEGHGFSKKENKMKAYREIFEFFEKHRLYLTAQLEE